MPWRRRPNSLSLLRLQYFFSGPWSIFLRDCCFPDSGAAARAAMWCSYMSCNVVCAKYSVTAP